MKKLISILAVVLLSVSAMAQVSTASGSLKTLKSFRLGTCKIVEVTKGEAVTYQITGQLAAQIAWRGLSLQGENLCCRGAH